MDQLKTYQRTSIKSGWTRADLLVMLYDRALNAIESCEIASEAGNELAFRKHELTARKTFLAIHSGLKPEENEVAFNIARLLEFVLFSFDQNQYEPCKKVLGDLRQGFAQVAEEANELERQGEIPPMPERDNFESIA